MHDDPSAECAPVALHLLAKAPLPGRVKTRLMPRLGAHGAASAHAEMVRRCVAHACQALPAAQVTLWTALDHAHPLFIELKQRLGIHLAPQPEGHLGVRIHHALTSSPGASMIMGSDCPSITPGLIKACAASLATHPVAILPAEDGGYGLIGIHALTPADTRALFDDIPWGGGEVLTATRERLAARGLEAAFPATVWDVDRPEDWQRYRRLYPRAPSLLPPAFPPSRSHP
ncbi:MAG: TIGR04282 family arsenosugar biosynthesis glycosyltransferase [Halomonas sp.]|nr:TIGR04282 family arsenosugar biosynthesis glycosyltransferase [Halomonas sp.]MDN6296595.1 TIGR04282 family arsenosugar biosynthesis glycosyltransferase [Halomonas sp.]MDN6314216.1 TIGR04282 family arsenosugar biosynthesis glycosyltransferase [Halomonas sp.]MDN6335101.1 TIGR04282 family arsenosugar biosynthesis glycosyltransferase [Halomonas sp.]